LRGCAEFRLPPAINPTIGAQKKISINVSEIIRAVITPFIDQSPAKNAKSFAFYYLALHKKFTVYFTLRVLFPAGYLVHFNTIPPDQKTFLMQRKNYFLIMYASGYCI
jgi:hypothetical protein